MSETAKPSSSRSSLSARPNLNWLKNRAKDRLRELRTVDASATLAIAQFDVARQYGFKNWRELVKGVRSFRKVEPLLDDQVATLVELIRAARPDVAAIRKLLGANPSLANARNADGASMLAFAVEHDRPQLVRLLIERGAATDTRYGRSAHTPLSWAMTVGAFKSAGALLKAGVKPDLFCAAGLNAVEAMEGFFDDDGYAIVESSLTGSSRYAADGTLLPAPPTDPVELASDALYIASRNGRTEAVRFLLSKKVDVNFRAYMGGTPLHWAHYNGSTDVIRLLRDAGADDALRDDVMKATPRAFGICVPANWGLMTLLKRHLRTDPTLVNLMDGRGAPLHEAARGGQAGATRALLKAGADPSLVDRDGKTALRIAEEGKREDVVAILTRVAKPQWSVEALPEHRKTHKVTQWKPIMDAAFIGDAAKVKKLIADGANPNILSTTPGAHRPLHRAIEAKKTTPRGPQHEAAVKALLDGGADPQMRGSWDRLTALQLAAIQSPRFVPLLVDAFKPFDIFHACVLLDVKRAMALLKKNPKLATSLDSNGYAPFHYVAASRLFDASDANRKAQLSIAQQLIDAGADVNGSHIWLGGGDWPISVLYHACGQNDNPRLTEFLMKAGAQPYDNESVYHASDEGHDACLAVIERYADKRKLADEATMCLRTQMHWGKSRGAKWLLEHGADPNSLHPQSGNSALHASIVHGSNDKVITMLLKHGADPKKKSRDGRSAFDLAKASKKKRIAILLKGWK